MQIFSDPHISIASISDIPALKLLLDSAYRGEGSQQGWTTEAHLIAGDSRTDELTLQNVMQQPGSVMLKYTDADGYLMACVNLQKHDQKIYLGMFAVSPQLQGAGIGKKLLMASEEYALHTGIHIIYMSVISVRTELIEWYVRHGYRDTGERKPFAEDAVSGKHLQKLEFMMLEKHL